MTNFLNILFNLPKNLYIGSGDGKGGGGGGEEERREPIRTHLDGFISEV